MDDGISSILSLAQNVLPSIFRGGPNDGVASVVISQQNKNPSIYFGGANDGVAFNTAFGQNNIPQIYTGGQDDGEAIGLASAQNALPSIYKGGLNDGVAGTTIANQNALPSIYTGGPNDGVDMAIKLRQNSSDPLPLSLLEFKGAWFNDDALLSWEIATTNALDHFELERSEDAGQHFSAIASIDPNQDPTQQEYRYTDVRAWYLNTDIILYRLKAVDKKGDFTYSAIATLQKDKSAPSFAAYPNPTSGHFTLALMNVTTYSDYEFQILSSDGKMLKRGTITNAHTPFDLSRYPAASYVLMLYKKAIPIQHFTIILTQ